MGVKNLYYKGIWKSFAVMGRSMGKSRNSEFDKADVEIFIYYDFITRKTYEIDKKYRMELSFFLLRFIFTFAIFFVLCACLDIAAIPSVILAAGFYIIYDISFRMLFLKKMPAIKFTTQKNNLMKLVYDSSCIQSIKCIVLSFLLLFLLFLYLERVTGVYVFLIYISMSMISCFIAIHIWAIILKFYRKYIKNKFR